MRAPFASFLCRYKIGPIGFRDGGEPLKKEGGAIINRVQRDP